MSSEANGTGIVYPTLELGGKKYTVKFTRGGLLYRLNRSGASFADLGTEKSFSTYIDILYAAANPPFQGTAEDLAELVMNENKLTEVATVVNEAIKKVFPPTQTQAAGTVGQTAPQVQ